MIQIHLTGTAFLFACKIPLSRRKTGACPAPVFVYRKIAPCFLRPFFTNASAGKMSYQDLPWFETAYETRKGRNDSLYPDMSHFVTHRLKQGVSALQLSPKRWQKCAAAEGNPAINGSWRLGTQQAVGRKCACVLTRALLAGFACG